MECVLSIVDSGTELRALAMTAGGVVVGRAALDGPTNPRFVTGHTFRRRLERVIADASATLDQNAMCLAVNTALWADPEEVRTLVADLVPLNRERVRVTSYERCALVGAVRTLQPERAIVIRADVSSRGWGIGIGGREASCGGFGNLFGDEGSTYRVGLEGLSAALKAFERRSRNTVLKNMLLEHFGVESYREVIRPEHEAPPLDRYAIASFAASVFEAGERDDRVALEILEEGGRGLATMALALINELDLIDGPFQVLPTGRVVHLRGALMETFLRTLRTKTAKANFIREGLGAAAGGTLLAIDHLGIKVRQEVIETLAGSLDA